MKNEEWIKMKSEEGRMKNEEWKLVWCGLEICAIIVSLIT